MPLLPNDRQQEAGRPGPRCLRFKLSGRGVLGFHLRGTLLGKGVWEMLAAGTSAEGTATSDGITGKQLGR